MIAMCAVCVMCRHNLLEMAGTEAENSVEAMRLDLLVKRSARLLSLSLSLSNSLVRHLLEYICQLIQGRSQKFVLARYKTLILMSSDRSDVISTLYYYLVKVS